MIFIFAEIDADDFPLIVKRDPGAEFLQSFDLVRKGRIDSYGHPLGLRFRIGQVTRQP